MWSIRYQEWELEVKFPQTVDSVVLLLVHITTKWNVQKVLSSCFSEIIHFYSKHLFNYNIKDNGSGIIGCGI